MKAIMACVGGPTPPSQDMQRWVQPVSAKDLIRLVQLAVLAVLAVLAYKGHHLLSHRAGGTGALAAISLGLANPVMQGLWCAADLR